MTRLVRWAVFVCGFCLGANVWASAPIPLSLASLQDGLFRIQVSDGQTRVLIAKVYLEVGDLRYQDGALVGSYSIRIPMRPHKNDKGELHLPLVKPIAELMEIGGAVEGTGLSMQQDEPIRRIICRVIPASPGSLVGFLELEIDTGGRVVEFATSYAIVADKCALSLQGSLPAP